MASSPSLNLGAYAVLPAPPSFLQPRSSETVQHEHKYLLDAWAARRVWTVASRHLPSLQDPARPFAFVRTTYFDTADRAYQRSAQGEVSQRLRVREYATATVCGEAPTVADRCFLELKQSANGRRTKARLELEPRAVPAELARHADAPLTPVLTTWYQRRSLGDADGNLRITLDEGVTFCAPISVGSPGGDTAPKVLARGPGLVLEIKHWGDVPLWLKQALLGLKEAVGFSKFNAGMLAIAGIR